jgi:hypothetical protein
MALYPGKLAYCGIALQGSSTTPVTPSRFLAVKSMDFDSQPHHTYNNEFRKVAQSTRKPIRDGITTEGSMTIDAYPGGGGLEHMLYATFGAVTTTTPAAGVGNFQFEVDDDDLPPLTIHEGLSNLNTFNYPYSKVKTMKLTLKDQSPVELQMAFVSRSQDRRYGEFTPTYTTPRALTFLDATAYIDGAASTLVQSMDITFDRATQAIKTMNGSMDPTYILPTDFKVNGNLKLFFDSETEHNRFMGNPSAVTPTMQTTVTPVNLKLVLTGGLISGAYYNAVTIVFPEAYYDKEDFKQANDSFTSIGFDFTAAYNDAAGYASKVYVQSGITTIS